MNAVVSLMKSAAEFSLSNCVQWRVCKQKNIVVPLTFWDKIFKKLNVILLYFTHEVIVHIHFKLKEEISFAVRLCVLRC